MAAPNEKGLKYFSHDVNMSSSSSIQYLESEFGLIGYAVYNKILEMLYKKTYFLQWAEKDKKVFAKKYSISIEDLDKIILTCCEDDCLFNKEVYERYGVITSVEAQRRFIKGSERRKEVRLIAEYWKARFDKDVKYNDCIHFVDLSGQNVNISHPLYRYVQTFIPLIDGSVNIPPQTDTDTETDNDTDRETESIPHGKNADAYLKDREPPPNSKPGSESEFRNVVIERWRDTRPGRLLIITQEQVLRAIWKEHGLKRTLWTIHHFAEKQHKDLEFLSRALLPRSDPQFYDYFYKDKINSVSARQIASANARSPNVTERIRDLQERRETEPDGW